MIKSHDYFKVTQHKNKIQQSSDVNLFGADRLSKNGDIGAQWKIKAKNTSVHSVFLWYLLTRRRL